MERGLREAEMQELDDLLLCLPRRARRSHRQRGGDVCRERKTDSRLGSVCRFWYSATANALFAAADRGDIPGRGGEPWPRWESRTG